MFIAYVCYWYIVEVDTGKSKAKYPCQADNITKMFKLFLVKCLLRQYLSQKTVIKT